MAGSLEEIVAESLRISAEHVRDELSMETLGTWDSLAHMELISALEQHYGVALTRDEIVRMTDVATIRAIMTAKRGSG